MIKTKFLKKLFVVIPSLLVASVYLSANAIASPLPTDTPTDVIIVGGGLSGLSTAYKLKKAGISYKILELAPRLGGRVRSVKYEKEDISVEGGLAEFWESNPAVDLIKELKLEDHSENAYSSLIINGKLYPFLHNDNTEFLKEVLNPQERKSLLNIDALMGKLVKQIHDKKIDKNLMKLKDISFADWIKKNGVPQKAQEVIRLSLEVEIGTTWDAISALDGIAEWHIFLGKGEKAYYLEKGNHALIDALADAVGQENIGTSMEVTRFKNVSDGVEIETRDNTTYKSYVYKAKYAVSTIPLFRLAEVQFEPVLTPKKQQAIYTQTWGSYFTAHVFMSKAASKYWTAKDGKQFLPILSDSPLGVIYSATPSDKEDTLVVNLLITGPHAEGFNFRGTLIDQARTQLNQSFDKLFPGISKYIKKYEFIRYHPRAIASWPVGRSRFDELSEEIRRPQGNIYFAGDFTESSHSDGAVYSAERVARDIAARLKKKK